MNDRSAPWATVRRRSGWRPMCLLLGLLLAIGGMEFGIWRHHRARLSDWATRLAEVGRFLNEGEVDQAAERLSRVEGEMEPASGWQRLPEIEERLAAVEKEASACRRRLNEEQTQQGTLNNEIFQVAQVRSFLERGELEGAEKDLQKIEAEIGTARAWDLPPALRTLRANLETQARSARQALVTAREKAKLQDWLSRIAQVGPSLERGEIDAAEKVLRQVEAGLGAAGDGDGDGPDDVRTLRRDVETQALSARQALDAARRYVGSIRTLVEAMRSHLRAGDYPRAVRTIQEASSRSAPGSDPVLASLASFVEQRRGAGRPWDGRDHAATEAMIREATDWKNTRRAHRTERYDAFLARHPQSPFADEARARLVDLEVAAILAGQHGTLPPAEQKGVVAGRLYSVVNIENDTSYELTLRYSGRDSFKVVFAAGEKGSIEARVGKYAVAASVNASHVRDYAGKEELTGGNYEVTYYIQSPLAYGVRLPRFVIGPGGSPPFTPWPAKRRIPDYLKKPPGR